MKGNKDAFLDAVSDFIKSREAKRFVRAELEHHIQESKANWAAKGYSEEEAESKAIEQMGSPSKLGMELNQLHKPRIDWFMAGLLAAALLLGFLPLIPIGEKVYLWDQLALNKLLFVFLGSAAAAGIMFIDYRRIKNWGWLFYGAGIALQLVVVYGQNTIINGSPYVQAGPLTLESSMAIPLFFLAWASFLLNPAMKLWKLIPLFLLTLYFFLLCSSLPTIFIYSVMAGIMYIWSTPNRFKSAAILFAFTFTPGCLIYLNLEQYQKLRIYSFLHPERYAETSGFIYLEIKEKLSQAGWLGNFSSAMIPEEHTDLVFVGFINYFGWLSGIILLVILVLFAARMLTVFKKATDPLGKMLIVGGITLYLTQLVYNIGMTIGLLPITTIALPFISYGLMPVLLNAVVIGLTMSVYRRKDLSVYQ